MIIEFEPHHILTSYPPQWWIRYKEENGEFKQISVTYDILKQFLEKYGYESNDVQLLQQFGISINNIKQNSELGGTKVKWSQI